MKVLNCLLPCVLCVAVAASFCVVASAQVTSFSISKSLSLENRFPNLAFSTKKSNALVVWVKKDDNDISEAKIYAALCVINKFGQCKVKNARMISEAGDICEWRPRVAYNPDNDSYLVVWSTMSGEIKTVKVTKAGRRSGAVNIILAGADSYPVVAYVPPEQATTVVASRAFLLSYADHRQSYWGLYTIQLDSAGAASGQAKKISSGYTSQLNRPAQIIRDSDGTYLIAHIKQDLKYGDCAYVARVRADGSPMKNKRVGKAKTKDIGIVQLSSSLYMAVFPDTDNSAQVQNQLFKSNLKPYKAPFDPYVGQWIYGCCIVNLQDSDCAVQMTQQGSYTLYYRPIGTDGKYPDKETYLGAEGHVIGDLNGACLPGTNTILLVYAVSHATNDVEIKGLLFNVITR